MIRNFSWRSMKAEDFTSYLMVILLVMWPQVTHSACSDLISWISAEQVRKRKWNICLEIFEQIFKNFYTVIKIEILPPGITTRFYHVTVVMWPWSRVTDNKKSIGSVFSWNGSAKMFEEIFTKALRYLFYFSTPKLTQILTSKIPHGHWRPPIKTPMYT